MDTTQEPLVASAGVGDGVTPEGATPAPEGVAAQAATPGTALSDAELESLREKYAKAEADLNRMKSSFQRKEYEKDKSIREMEDRFAAQLDQVRRSLLDEDDLKEYEAQSAQEKAARMERQYQEMAAQLEQERAKTSTLNVFSQMGVPMNILLPAADEGLEAVTTAAWGWLMGERDRLSRELAAAKASPSGSAPASPPPTAPKTAVTTSAPYSGPSWPDLVKQYGSEENVYMLVEQGRLPVSVIPGYKPEG